MTEIYCKFCAENVALYGIPCNKCQIVFRAGEKSGRDFVIKEISQEINQILRRMEAMK